MTYVSSVKGDRPIGDTKKRLKTTGADFSTLIANIETETDEIHTAEPINEPSSLIFLQNMVSINGLRQNSESYGFELLKHLDNLKESIIFGKLNKTELSYVESRIKQREKSEDQKLEAIIDEIELRLAVELAKYQ